MRAMSKTLSMPLSKIENWFKHQRRKDVEKGEMKFEVRILKVRRKLIYFFRKKKCFLTKKENFLWKSSSKTQTLQKFIMQPCS